MKRIRSVLALAALGTALLLPPRPALAGGGAGRPIAGGPKGDDLTKQIEGGRNPGIVETTLDGFDQRALLEGQTDESARDHFFYYSGAIPSAVRYKNWMMYYAMSQPGPAGSQVMARVKAASHGGE
jgi:hypothetical protein